MSNSNIGARKGRNIKDHLFIIYRIINSVLKGNEPCIDIQIYDLIKAFDSLWLEDCLNDAFDSLDEKKRDDKLKLLYESNKENWVAINTAAGLTRRVCIEKIVQQGGTWGPLLCSNSVDTLGKKVRDRGVPSYMYKNTVRVLPLAMVDDINAISRCGLESVNLNTFINTQIELKKIHFHVPNAEGKSKCHKMHIGGNKEMCQELKVHGTAMESVKEDTYLGDLISSDGKNKKNVEKRISKGLGIITQILNLLDIVSFGKHHIEMALLLRESMFINGILFNAEIWYGLNKAEINDFEDLDRLLLRRILKAPISSPKESFHLELGLIPIGEIIKIRRIQYLHHLVTRDQNEMLFQFFLTQLTNPTKGDWTETVKVNLEEYEIPLDFEQLKIKSKDSFKKALKKKAKEVALEKLKKQQEKHSKMKRLEYSKLEIQPYFLLPEVKVDQARNLFKLRTRMAPLGENFRGYRDSVICPLCKIEVDSQDHFFQCQVMREKVEIECDMEDIYTDTITQDTADTVTKMLETRKNLLEKIEKKSEETDENEEES